MSRFASVVVASLCALIFANEVKAGDISVSLNLNFNNPFNINSGGDWTVVAKADSFGLAGISFDVSPADFTGNFLVSNTVFEVQQFLSINGGMGFDIVNGDNLASPTLDVGVIGGSFPSNHVDPLGLTVFGSNPDLGSFTGGIALVSGTFVPGEVPDISNVDGNLFSAAATTVLADNIFNTVRSNLIPEPATLTLFGIGLIGLVAVTRRRT
ncbi:MAG: PEP-CTERM sorting domain-containing protein [Pirellulales bacterium]|nr:PEP-CTERM sorting domain-containing protein [Pirellulales bacterium]